MNSLSLLSSTWPLGVIPDHLVFVVYALPAGASGPGQRIVTHNQPTRGLEPPLAAEPRLGRRTALTFPLLC